VVYIYTALPLLARLVVALHRHQFLLGIGSNITIMTIYYLPPLNNPRESILIPLFPSILDNPPSIVEVTFSQEATEETEI
jgi:hypothetical protein